MPPPISAVLKKGNIHITNPNANPLTEYMVKLVYDEQINTIYYTRVKTPRGTYILVVDSTGEKTTIDEDEKLFIYSIGQEIVEVEKEKQRKEEKNKETISFLLGLLLHLFRNKITAIGGLSNRIQKISAKNKAGSECDKCREKTAKILKETINIEATINLFQDALHDIQKAETLVLESRPFCDVIKPLAITNIQTSVKVDGRKVEKFLERIPPPPNISMMEEDQYIKISFPLEDEGMWRTALSMRPQNGIKNNYSENEFLLLISIILFQNMGGKIKLLDGFVNIFFKRG
ncbi:hypothetical protein K8R61_01220 [bacterium]|nr:hypothetical protein [bacterium]